MVKSTNGANLGFEEKLWMAADKLRGTMYAAEYKHVVLGLIFLKYISDAFLEKQEELKSEEYADPEDRDEYNASNIFWVPPEARWKYLQSRAKDPKIGQLLDEAMSAIERDNTSMKGVLPKDYARPALDKSRLGELIDLIATIGLGDKESRRKDILGRVYEYFLSKFAEKEGKGGGEFYTPQCVVKLLVEMIEPFKGRVFDPCCGSGGSFLQDAHKDLKADFILANPPFNDEDWGFSKVKDDVRWAYGAPPAGGPRKQKDGSVTRKFRTTTC